MIIPYEGRYTWDDFNTFQFLHLRNNARRIVILTLICLVLLLTVVFFVSIEEYFVAGLLLILLVSLFPIRRLRLRRAWRHSKLNALEVSGEVTPDHITSLNRYAKSEVFWDVFSRYLCNEEMLILCDNQINYFFPRRFFKDNTDWNAFGELVKSKVPAK